MKGYKRLYPFDCDEFDKWAKRASPKTLAKILLKDESLHCYSSGYDSRLGIILAQAVLKDARS